MSDADSVASTLAAPLAAGDEARGTVAEGPKLLANRYELLGMLGAGAMGTVYRARDRELEESVALKVLNQELASKDMLERFRREVKLARRVTHANVARTFDIGEHEGIRFLTMELIEGEMLASLLARKGRLQVPQVVRLAIDVCAGLTAAHAANVLHRDLKPENVIVAKDGRAVITDFGIARAVREGELARTMGGIVGTPAYMAPEQVEGSSDLDARADLYALGAMLYELLTGVMAWQGDTIVAVAAGRLLRPPPDARDVVESLPDDIAELVLRLMARRKEDRPESATEVVRQLGLLGGRASSSIPGRSGAPSSSRSIPVALPALSTLRPRPGTRVIAVLPVLNLGTSEDAYLVDNVLEDLIDLLSVVPGLAVRPRGETVRFVDPARDVREIGRSVGSDVVVDGSFRRVGSSVRASFRLITVEDGFQLWARRFERPPSEVLSIADDAAHAIANALTAELRETKARSIDPETEELYLRGRFLFRRSWFDALGEAASVLERAYQRDPDDPRISGLLALTLSRIYGLPPNGRDVAERARVLANQALEVEPKQPEAQVALAILHLQSNEADAAVRYLRKSLAVAPNSVEALDWLGRVMAEVGRVDEGLALLRRASAIDPQQLNSRFQSARIHSILGDHEAMMNALGALPVHPGDIAVWAIIRVRDAMWRRDRAIAEELEKVFAPIELPPTARHAIGHLLKVPLGQSEGYADPAFLDQILPVDASRPPRRASFNAQIRAEFLCAIRRYPAGIEALRMGDGNGLIDIVWLDRCPLFDPLRGDPGFQTLRDRVALRARRVVEAIDARGTMTGNAPVGM